MSLSSGSRLSLKIKLRLFPITIDHLVTVLVKKFYHFIPKLLAYSNRTLIEFQTIFKLYSNFKKKWFKLAFYLAY